MTISIRKTSSHADNPFYTNSIATDNNFVGRESDLAQSFDILKANKNMIIRAERGMGKTSFLAELARRHAKDFEFIYLDLYGIIGRAHFLQTMVRELVNSYRGRDGTLNPSGWEILRSTRLKLAVLQKEHLTTTAADEIQTLAPPTKKDIELAKKMQKKLEIRMCPNCGKPLKWIDKYSRHYCYSCKKYVPRVRRFRAVYPDPDAIPDKTCPTCGEETVFVEKYSHFYCESCKKYPFIHLRIRQTESFTDAEMNEVLDLSQQIADQKEKHLVVMLDEFQSVASLEDKGLLKAMRARFEAQTDVSYVFAGSNDETVGSVFDDKDGPFYKFAEPLNLSSIDAKEMEDFLIGKFKSVDGKLSRDCARRIVALSGVFPGHMHLLAHELHHISREPSQDDLDDAIQSVIREQSQKYTSIWETIRSPLQRRYLIASVVEPRVSHGADFIEKHNLKSRSHIERAEKQLEARGIIEDGEVRDPLFILWIRSLSDMI